MNAANKTSKPPRPCTEYNIFFQLERAYILQMILSAPPENTSASSPDEVFHPSQPTYAGLPPLPSRYANLVLPYDWHLPGKERRRKRKHRKSHGAIGFQDLSLRIADAWRECVDVEIRTYCAEVCHVGMTKYKREVREWKKCQKQKEKATPREQQEASNSPAARGEESPETKTGRSKLLQAASDKSLFADENPQQVELFADGVTQLLNGTQDMKNVLGFDFMQDRMFGISQQQQQQSVDLSFDNLSSLTTIGDMVQSSQKGFFNRRESTLTTYADVNINRAVQCTPSSVISDVDIDDDEIISMWKDGGDGEPTNVGGEGGHNGGGRVYCRDRTPPPPLPSLFGAGDDDDEPRRGKPQDGSIDVRYRATFGPVGWTVPTLQDMRIMQDMLRRQEEELVELEKRTVAARSA